MPEYLHALPSGYQLHEHKIESVIGSGGFGITYKAQDINLDKPVAIKEYLPNEFALRESQTTVKPKSSSHQDDYDWGLKRFLEEARTLARFDHPHLNKVYRFFEANGTAYLVLEYIAGDTLSHILKEKGQLNESGLRRMLDELLDGLNAVHAASFIHRDIKPANIIFRADGSTILLDFGAARQAIGQRSQSITSILTPGYAPIEQYDQYSNDTGPWSDLYALGIVAYRCLRGDSESILIDAVARARLLQKGETDRDMPTAEVIGRGNYSPTLLAAIDWAIQVNENERPQSVAQMQAALAGKTATTSKAPPQTSVPSRTSVPPRTKAQPNKTKDVDARDDKGWTPLHLAAREGDSGTVESLLKRGARINAKDNDGWTPLHVAAREGHSGMVESLLNLGARVNAKHNDDWTPLHLATGSGHIKVVEFLLEHGANVHVKNDEGGTPLHQAARKGHSEVVEFLLEQGADVNVKTNHGDTPLHQAAQKGRNEMVELLLERGADVHAKNSKGGTPLHQAAREGHSEMVEFLLEQGVYVNAKENDGWTPLDHAIEQKKNKTTEALRRNGGQRNKQGTWFSRHWNLTIIGVLVITLALSAGIPMYNEWQTEKITTEAELQREMSSFYDLVEEYPKASRIYLSGATDLHIAAAHGWTGLMQWLIDNGAKVDAQLKSDGEEMTPVLKKRLGLDLDVVGWIRGGQQPSHFAAYSGHVKAVESLLKQSADVDTRSNYGRTPLHYAAHNGHSEMIEFLLKHGANVNAKDANNYTPLHSAAQGKHSKAVEFLLERGANVNAKDNNGWTPLHFVALAGHSKAVESLLERGADVNAKANNGWTSLDLVIGAQKDEVAEVLRRNGGRCNEKC